MEEKRRISRVDYQLLCTLSISGETCLCTINNISLTGLLVEVLDGPNLVEGMRASLLLRQFCPECNVSEIECRIVRKSGSLLGLEVSAIDYDTFEKLRGILIDLIPDRNMLDQEIINLLAGKQENEPDVQ